MKWFLIVNPAAGGGKCKTIWPKIQARLKTLGVIYDYEVTESAGQGTAIVLKAIANGYTRIAAVGGDGTGHEVINGILRNPNLPSDQIVFFQVPVGTGNDWPKTYGFPSTWEKSLSYLKSENTAIQDIAKVTYHENEAVKTRFSYNVVGLCFDAYIARKISEQPTKTSNKFKYLALVLQCLDQYSATRCRLDINGQHIEADSYLINVGICRYSGGGMKLVPHAKPADNLLAVTHAKSMTKWDIVRNLYRLYNGSIGKHPKVDLYETTKIYIESETPVYVEADGEFLGNTPVTIQLAAEKLRILAI